MKFNCGPCGKHILPIAVLYFPCIENIEERISVTQVWGVQHFDELPTFFESGGSSTNEEYRPSEEETNDEHCENVNISPGTKKVVY